MFEITYQLPTKSWSVSRNQKKARKFDQIRIVYLNEMFVWFILYSANNEKQPLMVSAESMTEEEFRQLRRYIMSPELFI